MKQTKYKITPPLGYKINDDIFSDLDEVKYFFISLFKDPPDDLIQDILDSDYKKIKENMGANGFKIKKV